ncbi:hypothetical protein Phi39:1_gp44 [Cellulophaga phage phi39:1]|uniref:hypothetical protein n=1 Tax=Cellulophaga phage phi39:1 TaxID=1327993 RepID=UPI000351ED9E|nr:hypothetical protein Phi39:1_gp44 [Cellulophaga phage phi39:1]AGO49159.1 hypothetical protein Phi39:1_gp44 [Cellulophaga phage phi39:1]
MELLKDVILIANCIRTWIGCIFLGVVFYEYLARDKEPSRMFLLIIILLLC